METFKIIKEQDTFTPIEGERTKELLSRFKISDEEKNVIKSEAIEILSNCADPKKDEKQSVTTLAVGYVQSGKTMSFITLSALANDKGFKIIVYLAGTKKNLLNQTRERLRKDLLNNGANRDYYKLYEKDKLNNEYEKIYNQLKHNQSSSKKILLIPVLKHHKHISELIKMFSDKDIKNALGNSAVLIIDDEADQASLNGYAFKNCRDDKEEDDYTAIYRSILELRNCIGNYSYVQYTATPQAPLLISTTDWLSPKSVTVLTPGKAYTGGKKFFKDEPGLIIDIPEEEVYNHKENRLTEPPESLKNALQLFFMGVAIVVCIDEKLKFLSMMVHADRQQDTSETFKGWIRNIVGSWSETLSSKDKNDIGYRELKKEFESNYEEAVRLYKKNDKKYPTFEEIWGKICEKEVVQEVNIELHISKNPNSNDKIHWNDHRAHILVGANMLDRGFTVENLAVTYMPRYSSGKSNADTIQQRCRFFGYKNDYLWSCRVFLPIRTQLEYVEYVEHEEEMRKWLKENKSLENGCRALLKPDNLELTRRNVLHKNIAVNKLTGWKKMNAFNSIEENTKLVDSFIETCDSRWTDYKWSDYKEEYRKGDDTNHRYVKIDIQAGIDFLWEFKFQNFPDSYIKEHIIRYLDYLRSKSDISQIYIFQMAYASDARERSFDEQSQKIKELHRGYAPEGKDKYPGDAKIKFDDCFCIQIHKVKLKCECERWNGKIAYTLAIYCPEKFKKSYISSNN